MPDITELRENYFLRESDPDFSQGRRSRLIYALESLFIQLTKVNLEGPDPHEYVEFAKRDLDSKDERGAINALGNAKRAIHLTVEKLLNLWGLGSVIPKLRFPERVALIKELDMLPTQLILSLNKERNFVEHEYALVEGRRALEMVELADLFITVAYQYFKHAVIGVYVGQEGRECCEEWFIDLEKSQIIVRDIPANAYIELPIGPVHYNIKRPNKVEAKLTVLIGSSNRQQWLPYIDLFAYCTRHVASRLPTKDGGNAKLLVCEPSLCFAPDLPNPENLA